MEMKGYNANSVSKVLGYLSTNKVDWALINNWAQGLVYLDRFMLNSIWALLLLCTQKKNSENKRLENYENWVQWGVI